jgi:GT2 family glycosyltransferase
MALPLINKFSGNFRRKRGVIGAIKKIFYRPFFGRDAMRREIRYSTNNAMPMMDAPGTADWLSGCCMAYRASVFGELQFDERLQRFGGYAMGEDVDFSHRVALKFGEPLLVVPEGHVVHHNSSGGRIGGERARIAAMYYNTKIIRENFTKYAEYGLLPFLWEQRVGRTIAMLAGGYSFADMAGGYLDYRKALREN